MGVSVKRGRTKRREKRLGCFARLRGSGLKGKRHARTQTEQWASVAEMRMLRWTNGATREDEISNDSVYKR